jgi:hypothetical protein
LLLSIIWARVEKHKKARFRPRTCVGRIEWSRVIIGFEVD